jgi:putative ABC transport system substrate-binding protein
VLGLLDVLWGEGLLAEVVRGLRESGLVEGKDFKSERSGWSGHGYKAELLADHAVDLVKRQVALILAFSNQAAVAAKSVTNTTPIIFLADDCVATSLTDRQSQPRGNLAGAAVLGSELTAKRIEIARELVPAANFVALVTDPTDKFAHEVEVREAQAIANALGLRLSIIAWTGDRGLEPDLSELPRDGKALLVFGGGMPCLVNGGFLAYLAVRYRIPAIHGFRDATEKGGLVSLGTRLDDGAHLMGICAARVLKGEKPADLPIQQMTRTELVINRWPAKSLGLQIPATLLARADEVIG